MAADVEKVVHAKLTAALAAASLSTVKIWPNTPPQDAALPYIVYALAGQQRAAHGGLVNAQVDVNCYAATYPAVTAIVEAIRRVDRSPPATVAGVSLRGMFVDNVADQFEPDTAGGETGYRSIAVSLRVFIIETNYVTD